MKGMGPRPGPLLFWDKEILARTQFSLVVRNSIILLKS